MLWKYDVPLTSIFIRAFGAKPFSLLLVECPALHSSSAPTSSSCHTPGKFLLLLLQTHIHRADNGPLVQSKLLLCLLCWTFTFLFLSFFLLYKRICFSNSSSLSLSNTSSLVNASPWCIKGTLCFHCFFLSALLV